MSQNRPSIEQAGVRPDITLLVEAGCQLGKSESWEEVAVVPVPGGFV